MPDGVYFRLPKAPVFIRIAPPTRAELQALVERIGANLGKHLERRGILVRDVESSYLALDPQANGFSLHAGQHPLCAKNAVPRRHDTRGVRAAGFSLAPGRAGTEPASEPDSISRRIRTPSSVSREDRARAGNGAQRGQGRGEALSRDLPAKVP
jgi:hypothetical protein